METSFLDGQNKYRGKFIFLLRETSRRFALQASIFRKFAMF